MSTLNTIYKKKNFKIYDVGKEYIVHNMKLPFETGHTHINNFHTCKYIIDLCIHKTIPHHLSDYLLYSIIRITEDKQYKSQIKKILNQSNNKKHYNYNERKQEYKNENKRNNYKHRKTFQENMCS